MKWIWIVLISLVIIVPVGFLTISVVENIQSFQKQMEFYDQLEIQTPEFSVSSLTGKDSMKVNLCADTLVALHYWGTWCKPCIEDFATFQSFYQSHKDSLQIMVISEEPDDKVLKFLEKRDFNLPFMSSDNLTYPFNVHHQSYPTTFFVRNCDIIKIVTGRKDWTEFDVSQLSRK